MTPLTQLLQIETVPLAGTRISLWYYLNNWKRCSSCRKLVKHDGRFCPLCSKTLSTKPKNQKYRRALQELRADPEKMKEYLAYVDYLQKPRFCSECGSDNAKSYKVVYGTKKPLWIRDGNGGHLCHTCYSRKNKKE